MPTPGEQRQFKIRSKLVSSNHNISCHLMLHSRSFIQLTLRQLTAGINSGWDRMQCIIFFRFAILCQFFYTLLSVRECWITATKLTAVDFQFYAYGVYPYRNRPIFSVGAVAWWWSLSNIHQYVTRIFFSYMVKIHRFLAYQCTVNFLGPGSARTCWTVYKERPPMLTRWCPNS